MNPRDGPTSFLEFNFSRKREKSVVNSWEHEIRSWIDRETHNTWRQSRETWQVCSGKNYRGVKCKTIIAAELKYKGLKHTEHLIWDHAKHIIWWEKPRNKANRDWRVIVKIYIFPHCCQFAAVGLWFFYTYWPDPMSWREFLYFYDKERSYLKVIVRYLQSLQSKLNTRDVIYTEISLWQALVNIGTFEDGSDLADPMVRIPM